MHSVYRVRGSIYALERMALLLLTLCFSPLPLQNNNFVVNQRKFWELIDSWHKDCQQAMPLGLEDIKVCYLFIFAFQYSIKYPPDPLVSEAEKKKAEPLNQFPPANELARNKGDSTTPGRSGNDYFQALALGEML